MIASLHTSFDRSPTERILEAVDNPHVDCIGHLTGRRLLTRDGARSTSSGSSRARPRPGTALEIDSQPDRLDMRDVHARLAGEAASAIPITTATRTRSPRSATSSSGSRRRGARG